MDGKYLLMSHISTDQSELRSAYPASCTHLAPCWLWRRPGSLWQRPPVDTDDTVFWLAGRRPLVRCSWTETSASIRWEAFKALIRGQIINFTSCKSKNAKQKFTLLESKINLLETNYYQNPCSKLHQEIVFLRVEYNEISSLKAMDNLFWRGA